MNVFHGYNKKDILELNGVRHSVKISRLLQLIAFQIGKEVSYPELATNLGLSRNTVERYLDLLEKVFVIRKLIGFSRCNLRTEITPGPAPSEGRRGGLRGLWSPVQGSPVLLLIAPPYRIK